MSAQRLTAWNGCTYQDGTVSSGTTNCYAFIPNEDTVVAVLTGSDGINYLTTMNLSGKTLKQGSLIIAPIGVTFATIQLTSGSIIRYK